MDMFGQAVALDGNVAVVGAINDLSAGNSGVSSTGRVYVFNATTGALITAINNPSPNAVDLFGMAVDIDGNTVVVGAIQDGSDGNTGVKSGRAYVFNATTGALITALNNPTPHLNDNFGASVSIDGNYVAIGAGSDESDGNTGVLNAGRAYVFNATTGALITTLNNPSPNDNDQFGGVRVDGDKVLVWSVLDESDGNMGVSDTGRAYLFDAASGTLLAALSNPYPNVNDKFGGGAFEGNTIVIGSTVDGSDGNAGVTSGRAYIFVPGGGSPGDPKVDCSDDGPPVANIQSGVPDGATLGGGCSTLGQLKRDASNNLLVCDDTPSQMDNGTCTGFEPGSLSLDKDGQMYACANIPQIRVQQARLERSAQQMGLSI